MNNLFVRKHITLLLVLSLLLCCFGTSIANASVSSTYRPTFYSLEEYMESPTEEFDTIYFSDEELFHLLRENGIFIPTTYETNIASTTSTTSVGVNKIVHIDSDHVDIYLSANAMRAIETSGVLFSVLLTYIPTIGPFLAALSTYLVTENINASTGWIFHLEKTIVEKGDEWGIKYVVYDSEPQ